MSAPKLQPCGTPAAWKRHRRAGEEPCHPCWAAKRSYGRRWMNNRRAHYPIAECAACHRDRPIQRNDWCESCVTRWQDAGRPDTGPPPLNPDAVRVARAQGAEQARAMRDLYEAIRRGGWEWAVTR